MWPQENDHQNLQNSSKFIQILDLWPHLDLFIPFPTIQIHQHREVRATSQLRLVPGAVHVLSEALALDVAIDPDPRGTAQRPAILAYDLRYETLDAQPELVGDV